MQLQLTTDRDKIPLSFDVTVRQELNANKVPFAATPQPNQANPDP